MAATHGSRYCTAAFYLALQHNRYDLKLWAAERSGYGGDERLTITANDVVIAKGFNPATAFSSYTFQFKAGSDGNRYRPCAARSIKAQWRSAAFLPAAGHRAYDAPPMT